MKTKTKAERLAIIREHQKTLELERQNFFDSPSGETDRAPRKERYTTNAPTNYYGDGTHFKA